MNLFTNFDQVIEPDGLITVVFVKNNAKKFCRTKVKEILQDKISIIIQQEYEVPSDQVLSVVYSSDKGLYGFHARIVEGGTKKLFCINKPREGWQIQRRKHDRIILMQPGMLKKGQEAIDCFVMNLSQSGLGVQVSSNCKVGEEIILFLQVGDIWLKEECSVIWQAENPLFKQESDYKYACGLKFSFITSDLKNKIKQIGKFN